MPQMVKEHSQIFLALLAAADLAITAGAWLLSYWVRFHTVLGDLAPTAGEVPPLVDYLEPMVVAILLALLVFNWAGLYRPRRIQSFRVEAWDILRGCVVVWLAEVTISYFLHRPPAPRVSIAVQGVFLVLWPAGTIAARGSLRAVLGYFRRHGRNIRTAAIVGTGRLAQKLLHALRHERWTGYRIVCWIDDVRVGQKFLGVPVLGPIDRVSEIFSRRSIDVVFIALPGDRRQRMEQVLNSLAVETVDVHVVPDLLNAQFLEHRVTQIGQLPIISLTESPQQGVRSAAKRLTDLLGALVALVLLGPVMLTAAILVKLTSPGPIFYRQRRASLGGREFEILKFRSMVRDADVNHDGWSTPAGDPRVTRVGRFIRKFSIDELPQLFNVLKGDMSLVGPRPEIPEFIHRFRHQVPRYSQRHHVKAGITGWAQVHGYRGNTSLRKRIQYDLDYINRWSLSLDLWILVLTVVRGFYDRTQ